MEIENKVDILVQLQDEATAKLNNLESQVSKLAGSAGKAGPSFLSMSAAVMAGQAALQGLETAGRMVIGFLEDTFTAAEKHQTAMALITNAIKNYGDRAAITATQAEDLANNIADIIPVSHDTVLAAEQVALKFDKINKDIFPDTIKLAGNMAVYLGTDVPSAMNMLGKALENPGLALRILKQGGVEVTASMADLLKQAQKTGDSAKAQALIIQALKDKYDGAGQAAATTFSGGMEILTDHVDRLKEGIGLAILNAINPFVQKLTAWVQTDQAKALIENITKRIGELVVQMMTFITQVAIPWVQIHWPQIKSAIQGAWDVAKGIYEFFSTHQWVLEVLIVALIAIKTAIMVNGVISAFSGIAAVLPGLMGGLGSLAAMLGTGGVVAVALVGVALLVYNAVKAWQAYKVAVDGAKASADELAQNTSAAQTKYNSLSDAQKQSTSGKNLLRVIQENQTALSSQGRAIGGSVNANSTYLVGEKGPELFMPNTSGTVIPNNKMGMNVTINFNGDINNTSNQSLDAIGKRIARQLELARFGLQS